MRVLQMQISHTLLILTAFFHAIKFSCSTFVSSAKRNSFISSMNEQQQPYQSKVASFHCPHHLPATTTSTCNKFQRIKHIMYQTPPSKNKADPEGLLRGAPLLVIALLYNTWMFSIPVEYRRAKTCSREQVESKLNCHCITTEDWWNGISTYYKNGGGVHFDLSLETDASKECREEF